jgi:hypothetical protein
MGNRQDMSDQREPDQTEDPRKQGTGQGYPESNPEETTPVEGTEEGPQAASNRPHRAGYFVA